MNQSVTRVIAWSIWLIASLFYAYQYILRVMPNVMLDSFIQQFHIDATIFGQYTGVYYLGYSIMHLPIGLMLDRFGPKKVMTTCILLTVVGLSPLLVAEHWIYPLFGRVLIGIGSSAAILGTFKIIRLGFQEHYFTRMLSVSVTIGLIGAIYGGGPVSYLCGLLHYKTVIEIFIGIGVLLALTTYFIIPELKQNKPKTRILQDIKEVLANRQVILLCVLSGMMVGPLEGFADVWGSAFLHKIYGYEKELASYLPSMIFMGMCFGGPFLSYIAQKLRSDLAVIILAGYLMMFIFILLIAQCLTSTSIILGFILVGVCSAYQILAIYKASTYTSEHMAGLTTAVANMIIMIFGYAFHSTIGLTINLFGGTNSPKAFIFGITVIPLTLAMAAVGFTVFLYKERSKTLRVSRQKAVDSLLENY